jgi:hypothetical protein
MFRIKIQTQTFKYNQALPLGAEFRWQLWFRASRMDSKLSASDSILDVYPRLRYAPQKRLLQ